MAIFFHIFPSYAAAHQRANPANPTKGTRFSPPGWRAPLPSGHVRGAQASRPTQGREVGGLSGISWGFHEDLMGFYIFNAVLMSHLMNIKNMGLKMGLNRIFPWVFIWCLWDLTINNGDSNPSSLR